MRIKMLSSYLDCLTMEETIKRIKHIIANKVPTQHVVINAGKINLMKQNNALREIINECPLINADGAGILLAAKILGYHVPERITGIDLMEELLKEANEVTHYSIFLLGAASEVIDKVVYYIMSKYPQVNIVGYHDGYFDRTHPENILSEIRKSRADILFVALPSPEKEFWIHRHIQEMDVPFVMGVGGSFDVIAGKTKRAPKLWQKFGCEWLWRFLQEPRRMFKRYFIGNFVFIKHIFLEKSEMK